MQRAIVRRKAPALDGRKANSDLHPVVQRVLRLRDATPENLKARLSDLLPPSRLKDSDTAAALLASAIQDQQQIIIVGDYDVDGATGTAVALEGLRALGAKKAGYRMPDRFADGYGLSLGMAEKVLADEPDVVMTVDNGIASVEGVAMLRQAGITVIVTDHHLAGDVLPDANAIVNPNQPECDFPSKALCGVGVMFYVLLQTRKALEACGWFSNQPKPALVDLLDLVALGTIADVVPLDENNRILVAQGVARMRAGNTRPGVRALLRVANCSPERLVTRDLAFAVAPRLNAAGRLTHIETGIECLLSQDEVSAQRLAQSLDSINTERKQIEKNMQAEALALLEQWSGDWETAHITEKLAIALYQPDWHEGVVGLIASRLKDKTGRPVAIFAPGNQDESGNADAANGVLLKGSVRSIQGVHIRDVLADIDAQHPDLIIRFGGHAMAAGLSLFEAHFEAFSEAFAAGVARAVDGQLPGQDLLSDGELSGNDFDLPLAEALRVAAPWGQAFPSPLFDNTFRVLNQRVVGEAHLKLVVQPLSEDAASHVMSPSVDAIAFRYIEPGQIPPELDVIRAVYQLDVNEFRGQRTVQLIIEYLEAA